MPKVITVWATNDANRRVEVDWDEALSAFADSFYAKPKRLPMSVEQRVHLFIESRYGTFVAPDSRDAHGEPSLSTDDYAEFIRQAERVLA